MDEKDREMQSFRKCYYKLSSPKYCNEYVSQESSKSCSLLGPEHTLLMDTLLDIQQHIFLSFLLGQANFVPLLVNSVVNSILAFSQLYLDVKKRYVNRHSICCSIYTQYNN